MDGTVRLRLRRRKTRSARIATPRVMICVAVPELRHLRYFVAVAEELSFSRAADRLHMAASPLSQAIRQLESELGVELFVRTTRHVELTEAGRRLLADGAAALAAVDAAFANAARAGRGVLGTLRLGSTPAARHEIRPALLARLRERHPGIEVDASEATTGNLCRELLEPAARRRDRVLRRARARARAADAVARADARADAARAPACARGELALDALRDGRFVVPGRGLNAGFDRRLRLLCREPASSRGPSSPGSSGTTASGRRATTSSRSPPSASRATPRRTCARRCSCPSSTCRSSSSGARTTTRRSCGRSSTLATPAHGSRLADRERRQHQLQQRADRERVDDVPRPTVPPSAKPTASTLSSMPGADRARPSRPCAARSRSSGRRARPGRGSRRGRPRRRRR